MADGVQASKLVGYALPAPPTGVDASKLVAYALPAPPIGVDCSKLVAYAILGSTNFNPPVWPNFSMPNGVVGVAYSATWDLSPAAPPTTYTVVSGSLPPGLTLNSPSADLGSITGTPTTVGTYPFTLRATNAYGTADKAFSITITSTSGGGVGGSFTYAG